MRILFSFFAITSLVLSAYAGEDSKPSIPFWSCYPYIAIAIFWGSSTEW